MGIYRDAQGIQKTIDKLAELKERYRHVRVNDKSQVFNTDWLSTIELGYTLDVAQTMAYSALNRKESRGSHQRLDATERDDVNFLQHTLAFYQQGTVPKIDYSPVKITKSQPAKRVYGAEGEETK